MKKRDHTNTAFYLLFLLLMVTSCSKQIESHLTDQPLTGTWKWIRTDGGIANHIHETPESTAKNIDLRFTEDKHYFIYTNGTLTSQGIFNLEIHNCIHDHTNKNVINFSVPTDRDMMIEKIDSPNLELSDDSYDGTASLYIRK